MKKKWSLMTKLMSIIALTSTLTIFAIGFINANKAVSNEKKSIDETMVALIDTLTLASSNAMEFKNVEALQKISNQIAKDPLVVFIKYKDEKGNVIASAEDAAKISNDKSLSNSFEFEIMDKSDKIIGFLELNYSYKSLVDMKKSMFIGALIESVSAALILILLIWFVLKKSINNIGAVSTSLKEITEKTKETSESIKRISEEVSSSSVEQAASVQETVATLDEINSMVNTSVDGAQNSAHKAEESHRIANDGKGVVREMITAMEEIDSSNKTIMDEISKSNERIASIVKVIDEISQKTTVINDIVFQTKLLSFNASVEAARAGEHGKGFAVVAEEVGNLAQMSGKASNEISQMLQESINRVNDIISETNQNVKKLIETGNDKVKRGVETADRCGKVLDEVVENAALVKTMMNEVYVASKEQAEGVKNISLAMNQIDQTTHANTNAANKSFENAKALSLQSEELKKCVDSLEVELFGGINQHQINRSAPSNVIELKTREKNNVVHLPIKKTVKEEKTKKPEIKKESVKILTEVKTLPVNEAKNAATQKPQANFKAKKVEPIKKQNTKEDKQVAKKSGHSSEHSNESQSYEKKGNQIGLPAHNDPRFEEV